MGTRRKKQRWFQKLLIARKHTYVAANGLTRRRANRASSNTKAQPPACRSMEPIVGTRLVIPALSMAAREHKEGRRWTGGFLVGLVQCIQWVYAILLGTLPYSLILRVRTAQHSTVSVISGCRFFRPVARQCQPGQNTR